MIKCPINKQHLITFFSHFPCALRASLRASSTLETVLILALFPMTPILQTLPAVGPKPPEISTRWFFMQYPLTAAQSTPCGTLMVLTVGGLALGSGTNIWRPISLSPDCRWSAQSLCLLQQFSSPSSATIASPSLKP